MLSCMTTLDKDPNHIPKNDISLVTTQPCKDLPLNNSEKIQPKSNNRVVWLLGEPGKPLLINKN